jgi:hypothetical protein
MSKRCHNCKRGDCVPANTVDTIICTYGDWAGRKMDAHNGCEHWRKKEEPKMKKLKSLFELPETSPHDKDFTKLVLLVRKANQGVTPAEYNYTKSKWLLRGECNQRIPARDLNLFKGWIPIPEIEVEHNLQNLRSMKEPPKSRKEYDCSMSHNVILFYNHDENVIAWYNGGNWHYESQDAGIMHPSQSHMERNFKGWLYPWELHLTGEKP